MGRRNTGEKEKQEQMPEQGQTHRRQHRSRKTSEGITAHGEAHTGAGMTPEMDCSL